VQDARRPATFVGTLHCNTALARWDGSHAVIFCRAVLSGIAEELPLPAPPSRYRWGDHMPTVCATPAGTQPGRSGIARWRRCTTEARQRRPWCTTSPPPRPSLRPSTGCRSSRRTPAVTSVRCGVLSQLKTPVQQIHCRDSPSLCLWTWPCCCLCPVGQMRRQHPHGHLTSYREFLIHTTCICCLAVIVLVGNKSDLAGERAVSTEDGQAYADR